MRKITNKAVSVILVMALCVSTLWGALIPASAATAGTYNIVGEDIAAGTKVITMEVTLTDPTGMTNGKFDLMLGKDVIDDANFGTKVNDEGETVPDYDNYLSSANSFTLEDLVGEKTETRVETTKVTNDFEWHKDTATATQWSTSDPDGAELGWQSTGNTQTKDNWVKVEGSTQYATSDPDGDSKVWQSTGNSKTQDNWAESTVNLKLSEVPADTATVKYVQGAKVQDNWSNTTETKRANYDSTGIIDNNGTTRWVINTNDWVRGAATGKTKTTYSTQSSTDEYEWVKGSWTVSGYKWTQYYKSYLYTKQTNDPTYTYTKRENKPVTTYEYQQYQNKPVTETEYQKYNKVYFETLVSYGASKLDTDGNNMIANINTYELRDVEVPVYDAEGNQTGTTTEKQKVLIDSHVESVGNKGTLLPNAYDSKSGLWNTKIEITGGTRLDGTAFNVNDFVNDGYSSLAGTTAHAIAGEETDGRKYVYNMTDDYYESVTGKPITTTKVTVVDGETTTTTNKYVNDINMLHGYYREYTTVDVATANLGYKISTVSEDSVGPMPSYSQYAQGFKDITFNTASAYTSVTFTVTLDFTGICDRVSANLTVENGNEIGTADDGVTTYRNSDGHFSSENYVGYGKKYELNLINATGDVADLAATADNEATSFSHVHDGHIDEKVGKADPYNLDAIKAAGLEKADNETYFNLFEARCSICGRVTPMLAATNLPYREYVRDEDGNATGTQRVKTGMYSFNNYRNLSGVNLTYQEDGTVSLNIHFPNTLEAEKFIITDQNGKVLRYSDTVPSSELKYTEIKDADEKDIGNKKASFFAATRRDDGTGGYDGILMSTARMITIDNLSAKDADTTLYIARYTPKSSTETELMGITHAISLAEYCNKVINEDDVYYFNSGDTYTESEIEADKLVAAAFMNYANASKIALGTQAPKEDEVVTIPTEIDLLEFGDYLINDLGSTSTWYDNKLADNGETGDSWENAIIIDSAEELVYLCKASGNDTDGKYYKVADNIAGFNLATNALDLDGTLADNIDVIKGSGKNHSGGTPGFQGHFDGNGITVYGAWINHTEGNVPAYAGLFSCAQGDVTIKNTHVKLASFTATTAAGGIVGYYKGEGNHTNNTTLTIENCSVTDSHLEVTTTDGGRGVGAVVGRVDCPSGYADTNDEDGDGNTTETLYVNNKINVKNCYVNLDEDYFISVNEGTSATGNQVCHGGVAGFVGSNALNVQNCVVIGITPYATSISTNNNSVQHSGLETHFTNVYTTSDVPVTGVYLGGTLTNRNFTGKVIPLTDSQLKGLNVADNMPNLNWDTVWCATESYPTLYAPYNVPELKDKTIYWDGSNTKTAPTEGSGTKNDPYIIRTVAELAYISGQARDNYAITDGKYYKIADGIKSIVMQPEAYAANIMALDSAEATKAYFEANKANMKTWLQYGRVGSTFCGNIDFNGATVYGIYQSVPTNAGLFSNIDAGAVISNLTIKNSYMQSNKCWNEKNGVYDEYQVGAIGAVTNGSGYGKKATGFIWIKGCTVANNYMNNLSTSHDRSGVIIGASADVVYIDNCLVYGNDATYGDGVKMSIWSNANNNTLVSSAPAIPDGLSVVDDGDKTEPRYYNMVRNSIILGALPYDPAQQVGARFNDPRCFKDVYTDAEVTNVACASNTTFTASLSQLAKIDVNEINGLSAKINMPNLDWYDIMTNPTGTWHYSYFGGMPSLQDDANSIIEELAGIYPEYVAAYNNIQFTPDTLGAGTEYHGNGTMSFGVYKTALSLKANPYMSFAFAFHGDYKTNRDKIKVRFTYTQDGATKTTEEISVPAYTGADIKNVDGWTNGAKNGRYHTYKADQIPVEAMADGIKVEASYNGGVWKDLGTFSVAGIGNQFETAYSETPCEYYATRVEAAKAFLFYVQQIKARYYNA